MRDILEHVLWQYVNLVNEVVELLGRAAVEPRDSGERITHGHGVDIRDVRRDLCSSFRILVEIE